MKTFQLWATVLTSVAVLAADASSTGALPSRDARDDYRQLVKDYDAATVEFEAEVERLRATDAAEAEEYAQDWSPTPAFVESFAEAAELYVGTDDAVQFLAWILENDHTAGEDLSAAALVALDTLIDQHAGSASFSGTLQFIGFRVSTYGEARSIAICDRVIERAQDKLVHAGLYGRGLVRIGRGATSQEFIELAKADFGAIPAETEIGKQAQGYLFELENLMVGMLAPDIAERDLDGVEFKLSDYRGKVVVIDFWGDW